MEKTGSSYKGAEEHTLEEVLLRMEANRREIESITETLAGRECARMNFSASQAHGTLEEHPLDEGLRKRRVYLEKKQEELERKKQNFGG